MTPTATKHMHTPTRCSFCGKPTDAVAKIIAGPGVYICNECVGLCTEILNQSISKQPATDDWTQTLGDEALLHHLADVAKAGTRVEESMRFLVATLRGRNITWARIGDALGMTRQSAWERFSGEK